MNKFTDAAPTRGDGRPGYAARSTGEDGVRSGNTTRLITEPPGTTAQASLIERFPEGMSVACGLILPPVISDRNNECPGAVSVVKPKGTEGTGDDGLPPQFRQRTRLARGKGTET